MYSEKDGQVVLTMSREDYDALLKVFSLATVHTFVQPEIVALLNRLNSGKPDYTPYQVEEESGQR